MTLGHGPILFLLKVRFWTNLKVRFWTKMILAHFYRVPSHSFVQKLVLCALGLADCYKPLLQSGLFRVMENMLLVKNQCGRQSNNMFFLTKHYNRVLRDLGVFVSTKTQHCQTQGYLLIKNWQNRLNFPKSMRSSLYSAFSSFLVSDNFQQGQGKAFFTTCYFLGGGGGLLLFFLLCLGGLFGLGFGRFRLRWGGIT